MVSRLLLPALAAACLVFPLSGCGGSSTTGAVQVRVVNVTTGLTIAASSDADTLSSGLAPGSATSYQSTSASGILDIIATNVATSTVFASTGASVSSGQYYTFFVGGATGSTTNPPVVWNIADNVTAPASGNARIRVVDASANAANSLDVYVTAPGAALASPTYTGLAYEGLSSETVLTAGSYEVRVTPSGNASSVLADLNPLALTTGQVRTILIADRSGGGVSVVVLPDLN